MEHIPMNMFHNVSEYGQEIPESNTLVQLTAPRRRDTKRTQPQLN